nr:peptide ligase PGM1-related protein [Paenibacillus sp. SYP-B3998]
MTEVCSLLIQEGLLYDPVTEEGIIVYTSGTLPSQQDEGGSAYTGRLFTLLASKGWANIEALSSRLEHFIDRLSHRITV